MNIGKYILHYVIRSNNSSDIILSEFTIEKDFISNQQVDKQKEKNKFIESFKSKISRLLPVKLNKYK